MDLKILVFFLIFFPQSAFCLCVKSNVANLRSKPNGPVTWTAPQYTPLVKLDKKGRWYKVQTQDGKVYWVFDSILTSQYSCLSISTATANLRKGPGAQYPFAEFRTADKFFAFKRIGKQGGWYQIQASFGEKFWVHSSNIWRPVRKMRMNYK